MNEIIQTLINKIEKEKQDVQTSGHYRMTDDGYIEGLETALEFINELAETPQQVTIDPLQLFSNTLDVRKYLSVDVGDTTFDALIENEEYDAETIKEVLDLVDMFVRIDELPEQIEVTVKNDKGE